MIVSVIYCNFDYLSFFLYTVVFYEYSFFSYHLVELRRPVSIAVTVKFCYTGFVD